MVLPEAELLQLMSSETAEGGQDTANNDDDADDGKMLRSKLETTREFQWLRLVKRLQESYPHIMDHIESESFKLPIELPGELRCPIRLSILVGNIHLVDTIDWDILATDQAVDPETFAGIVCRELGLGGEFLTGVSHAIREQIYMYLKCLRLIGYQMDGGPVLEEELSEQVLPVIEGLRSESQVTLLRGEDNREDFTPQLNHMDEAEMEKMDKDRDREARRKRRGVRGRRATTASKETTDILGFSIIPPPESQSSPEGKTGLFSISSARQPEQNFGQVTLPDMKDPPQTRRTLLFKHGNRPLFLGEDHIFEEFPEALAWVRKYAGTRAEGTEDTMPTGSSRKKPRMAAQQAQANISNSIHLAMEDYYSNSSRRPRK